METCLNLSLHDALPIFQDRVPTLSFPSRCGSADVWVPPDDPAVMGCDTPFATWLDIHLVALNPTFVLPVFPATPAAPGELCPLEVRRGQGRAVPRGSWSAQRMRFQQVPRGIRGGGHFLVSKKYPVSLCPPVPGGEQSLVSG